jgi:DMSO/TMAO reductase YedYZ molybdopterin-dependent catalytic subunit
MLVAAIIEAVSPIDAVGSAVIDRSPSWVRELAIQWFDTDDKLALRIGIVTLLGLAAMVVGVVALRRRVIAVGAFAAFGVVGAWAALSRPGEPASAFLPSVLGATVGAAVLTRLTRLVRGDARSGPIETPGPSRVPLGWDRRRFLVATGAAAASAAGAGALSAGLERRRVQRIESSIPDSLPPPASTVSVPSTAGVVPTTPYLTPNADFYRIDTALSFPRVDLDRWRLDLTGMVRSPVTFTYAELLGRPQVERVVTLCCVSNEVGGPYVGNAVWQGVLLADLLDEAGVDPAAEQVFSTSLDGWTCGFPVALARDGRDAMVAIGMNGEPLPLAHGFPARLVVPGLYGYVSATKWLRTIELTTWDRAEGYWVPRGWAREAPVKTQSRIDVPRRGETVAAGQSVIAGVAWAQHRGIERVEVRVDEGDWVQARLGDDVTHDAWRQWVLEWDAAPGTHTIQVRATDATGATQTDEVRPPAPDGATGYHTRRVTVA